MAPPDIAILGGRAEGWHGLRLRHALEGRGLSVHRIDLADCSFAVGTGAGEVRLGELGQLPQAALVRSIPAGSFEQVTLRLGLLHALEAMGVAVINTARAIERCVDKSTTSFLLARAGLPTPATWVVEQPDAARLLVEQAAARGERLVLKPLFGAQGRGLRLLGDPGELPAPEEIGGVYYLQRFLRRHEDAWRDFRVFVVGHTAVAAMARRGVGWITNVGQGGIPEPTGAEGRLAELAVAATAAVGADHAGVDLIEDEHGRLQILEVNSMPAWQGLQSVCAVDVAAKLAAFLAGRVAG